MYKAPHGGMVDDNFFVCVPVMTSSMITLLIGIGMGMGLGIGIGIGIGVGLGLTGREGLIDSLNSLT